MSHRNTTPRALTRRQWVVLITSGLAGCGGGAGGLTASLPGTGGTGIFSQGAIAGFGSVIVNSVKFDDSAAAVLLNGVAASSADLRLGMVAEILGQRAAGSTLGTASQIAVWSIAQGAVGQVQSGRFVVAGMVVQTDAATVFDGIASTTDLRNGMQVAVWGLQAGSDGNRWTATRVELLSGTNVVTISTGLVGGTMAAPQLNGMRMTGSLPAGVTPGQLLRVQGTQSGSGMQVDALRSLGLPDLAGTDHEVEIEGVVTALVSPTRFMLGNQEVDAGAVSSLATATVVVGSRVDVHGSLQGAVLKATALEVQSVQKLDTVEIEARVDQFTSLANFTVRGQRCDATNASITKGKVSDLQVGVRVKLEGSKAGNVVSVTSLEINV